MSLNAGASAQAVPPPSQPSASNATTAAGAVSTNVNLEQAKGMSSSTTISSLSDLKTKAPKIYNFMMLSIAQNMCTQMNRQNDRLIEEMKKFREKDNG